MNSLGGGRDPQWPLCKCVYLSLPNAQWDRRPCVSSKD